MDRYEHHLIDEFRTGRLSRADLIRRASVWGISLSALAPLLGRAGGWQSASAASLGAPTSVAPVRGGRLRVGIVGGGSSESLNPTYELNEIDIARVHQLYERLVEFNPDGSLYNQLAEEISPNADATVWTIKLRRGVLWHDGSPFTADDVVYSLRYVLDPAHKAEGKADLFFLKPSNVRRLDAMTVQLTLDQPIATLPSTLSSRTLYIFKNGTTSFAHPIGSGPFKFKRWTRGERSLFVRNDLYRVHGRPYLDEIEIISINDPTTRLNTLIAGQIDAMATLPPTLVTSVKAKPRLRVLLSETGGTTCQFMQVDKAPFVDNRVRQAFRLMVDREQIIKTVLLGYGKLGNDLFSPFDPDYATEIPQRPYDPEKAKFLLKKAGRANLTVSLYTGDAGPGMLDSSILIAQQAKKVGVTIKLDKVPADQYYSLRYMKAPFESTDWGQHPLDTQVAQSLNSDAPYNETDWKRPAFDTITSEARRTLNPRKRHELWVEAQRMLWDQGGYIIWGFADYIDAYSAKVHGLRPSSLRPLGWYTFTDVYLA